MLKIPDTPAKHKKQKGDSDLGVAPISKDTLYSKIIPIATPARPTFVTANQGMENTATVLHVQEPRRPLSTTASKGIPGCVDGPVWELCTSTGFCWTAVYVL